ncbi:hypothetical protein [Devosia sp. Naph2]|uniref:hypothetical protein n=1 Tax=Devosia polycyclovorans TaxID=3345148 RepID=UPI0035D0EA9B
MKLQNTLLERAKAVVDRVTFDDSGMMGQGGNGGLLSRETICAVDELRLTLNDIQRLPAAKTED